MKIDLPPFGKRRLGAIISAYTGVFVGELGDLCRYLDEKIPGSTFTVSDLRGSRWHTEEMRRAAYEDFTTIHNWIKGDK